MHAARIKVLEPAAMVDDETQPSRAPGHAHSPTCFPQNRSRSSAAD